MPPVNDNHLLKLALQVEIEERMDSFLSSDEVPVQTFSKKFERKMKKLVQKESRPKVIQVCFAAAKRVAVVILVASLLTMTTVLSVEALRIQFFNFIAETFEKYSVIYFEPVVSTEEGEFLDQLFLPYVPTEIPEGFYLEYENYENSIIMVYTNNENASISYSQDYLSGVGMDLNTEGVELVPIKINGCFGYFYSNLGVQSILWYDDTYLYSVVTTLSRDQAENIAKSVILKK